MPLNIKNREVERLVEEVAGITGETKTEAVRKALLERRARLRMQVAEGGRAERITRFLEREVWPRVPDIQLGKAFAQEERERILGYRDDGGA